MTASSDPVTRAVNVEISARLLAALDRKGQSRRWLASQCNVSPSYFASGKNSMMSLRTIYRACEAVGVELCDVLPTVDEYRTIRDTALGSR